MQSEVNKRFKGGTMKKILVVLILFKMKVDNAIYIEK